MKLLKLLIILFFLFVSNCVYSLPVENVETINNSDYFIQVDEMLKGAKKSIYVIMFSAQYYDAYPLSPSNVLLRDLVDAKNKNLDVKVIIENGESGRAIIGKNSKEQMVDNSRAIQYLKDNNVPCVLDPSGVTTHSKLIIIDEIYTVIGSTNWSYSALVKNNETSVLIKSSEIAKSYTEYFKKLFTPEAQTLKTNKKM